MATTAMTTSDVLAAHTARSTQAARSTFPGIVRRSSPTVNDEKIANLLSSVPQRSVILIEDVDAFFRQRDKADNSVTPYGAFDTSSSMKKILGEVGDTGFIQGS